LARHGNFPAFGQLTDVGAKFGGQARKGNAKGKRGVAAAIKPAGSFIGNGLQGLPKSAEGA